MSISQLCLGYIVELGGKNYVLRRSNSGDENAVSLYNEQDCTWIRHFNGLIKENVAEKKGNIFDLDSSFFPVRYKSGVIFKCSNDGLRHLYIAVQDGNIQIAPEQYAYCFELFRRPEEDELVLLGGQAYAIHAANNGRPGCCSLVLQVRNDERFLNVAWKRKPKFLRHRSGKIIASYASAKDSVFNDDSSFVLRVEQGKHVLKCSNSNLANHYVLESNSGRLIIGLEGKKAELTISEKKLFDQEMLIQKQEEKKVSPPSSNILLSLTDRSSCDELYEKTKNFDIVSFDIFDTALLRTVEFPTDIFEIMAIEMHWPDFRSARKEAEDFARKKSEQMHGHREITINDIYSVLRSFYNIDEKWKEREIELEKQSSLQNPFIFNLYKKLVENGKRIIFMTDMYLLEKDIHQMLMNAGYDNFEELYVSNIYKVRKGDGSFQKMLLNKYNGMSIIHIGDNKHADVDMSEKNGIAGLLYQDVRIKRREQNLTNLSGSVYRAIINNNLNSGMWQHGLHYTHGFRVGGILAAGYCIFINEVVHNKHIDKILFCGRDCYIIQKVYDNFYRDADNSYMEISRYAIMNLSPERYAADLLTRFIFRYWDEHKGALTIQQLLCDMGYDFMVPYLEENDLDRFVFCNNIKKDEFSVFFLSHIHILEEHIQKLRPAAIAYYKMLIGPSKTVLVADVGWSGTCISALEYFVHQNISRDIKFYGSLICASDTVKMYNQIQEGSVFPYISAPGKNEDIKNFMMPPQKGDIHNVDIVHMPLEYLFTAKTASLIGYNKDNEGHIVFLRDDNLPSNPEEIEKMQQGIYDFNDYYVHYTAHINFKFTIPPYVASVPLLKSIEDRNYLYDVYKSFLYDACTAPGSSQRRSTLFASFFPEKSLWYPQTSQQMHRRILFVTPELTYTGTPRSMLRVCRLTKKLGYAPIIWSQEDGPFREEFIKDGFEVQVVLPNEVSKQENMNMATSCELAFCNTIVTDEYVRALSHVLPTIWFIREATNIPDFCQGKPERLELLREYDKLFCVSEYAANAIRKYSTHNIHIIHNCVEDESHWANDYIPGSGPTVKFVQFGTMEFRKGYDVLIAAYKLLPTFYQKQCELFFAGGFINSGTPYCDYIFAEMDDIPNIHYLGIVAGSEKKIKTLSDMDVVVVASRDESCSLVALEGAMLAKPLIVTQNVGAKYIVGPQNGIIVDTGDAESMKQAIITLIDKKNQLCDMGRESRRIYESKASIMLHEKAFKEVYASLMDAKQKGQSFSLYTDIDEQKVIISLTSYPARMNGIETCINSLISQTYRNRQIILWLSKDQFPQLEKDLSAELLALRGCGDFEIRWVDGDIKSHKKYFYACQEFNDLPVIIVDDDVNYDPNMVRKLMQSYNRFPHCISCHRANLMRFSENKSFRKYQNWKLEYTLLVDTPSYQLLATGVGGVLYPPHSLPSQAFNANTIIETCLYGDDLWLKFMATINNYPTVLVKDYCLPKLIDGTQEVALWKHNVKTNNNIMLDAILKYFETAMPEIKETVLDKMRRDRYC